MQKRPGTRGSSRKSQFQRQAEIDGIEIRMKKKACFDDSDLGRMLELRFVSSSL